jgi:hypothetical protein
MIFCIALTDSGENSDRFPRGLREKPFHHDGSILPEDKQNMHPALHSFV